MDHLIQSSDSCSNENRKIYLIPKGKKNRLYSAMWKNIISIKWKYFLLVRQLGSAMSQNVKNKNNIYLKITQLKTRNATQI